MSPELFTAQNVIVQGITGTHGAFHTRAMLDAGTQIVAGTSPNKAGETVHEVPVFRSIKDIQDLGIRTDISVIFVPAPFARAAIIEAIEAHVPLVVVITEGVPVHDMLEVNRQARANGTIIIGPNCPGILMPGINKLGIIPANMGTPGSVAIVSRSGTLTYEAMAGLSAAGIGQRYVFGIGGDRIKGTDFTDCLELFEHDNKVDRIVLIGEIGGTSEHLAAAYIKTHITKPVFAYVAGHQAPPGVQLGHAGAILGGEDESASAKTKNLHDHGAMTANSITELIRLVADHKV
ncbi:succinate--CoA ligase subunit alpha [Candidatus Saccharibacteria bacterium]|nr:MAG: succinate--CoA ligase subunit alpha [Candidatus Saccharibacteria bacterium]